MSVSNTSGIPMLAGGFITPDMIHSNKIDSKIISVKDRRTKIVCTIGPASWSLENLGKLMDAGMNVARFNFSHGSHEGHGQVLDRLRQVASEKSRNIAVLLDTKGPEIRTGFFMDGIDKITLKKDDTIILTSDYTYKVDKALHPTKLACSYAKLATSVIAGQEILIADGSLVLTVLSVDMPNNEVTCRIENNTSLGERKNMNLPG